MWFVFAFSTPKLRVSATPSFSLLKRRMRGSSNWLTMASLLSVDPSFTTTTSKSEKVCSKRLSNVALISFSLLYKGIITEKCGIIHSLKEDLKLRKYNLQRQNRFKIQN